MNSASVASAATSSTLNFQGRLLSSSGNLVPDGVYNIEFKLYDGGTQGGPGGSGEPNAGSLLWTETRDFPGTDDRVRIVNGYFSVNLGSVTAFPGTINWDQELWLTMNVGGSGTSPAWDGEMLAPTNKRTKLTAVPYAFEAGSARALIDRQGSFTGALDFLALTANRNIDLPDADGTVLLNTTGFGNGGSSFGGTATLGTNDANDLIFETGGVEGLRIDQDGDVGIGTLADAVEALEVNGGIKLGNTGNTNAGTLRWTGTDFEGYDGASWVSLTSGGAMVITTATTSFISGVANLPATATGTLAGLTTYTSATAISSAAGSNTFVAPSDGSFRSCTVVTNADRNAGSANLRWRVNGASVGSTACTIDATNIRTSSTALASGVVSFSAGDTIGVAFDSASFGPTNTEFTAYWTVEYGTVDDSFYTQGGNSFGQDASLGTNDNFGLNFETNGLTRFSISSSGTSTFNSSVAVSSGGLSVTGGIDNNSGGITEAGSITGVGSNITATNGLTIASGGAGNLTLDSASNTLMIADSTIRRDAGGATTINLFDGANTTLSILNSDGTATADLLVEGSVSATGFSGSGAGLTSLDADNISSGTLDDARLSSNVALLDADQIFSGEVTFSEGLILQNSTSTTAGALRWTGTDFEGYDGASWMSLTGGGGGGPSSPAQTSVTKTTNECVNNTGSGGCASTGSTLQDDNQLTFAIGAEETWSFRFVIQANSSTAADFQFAVSAPTGSTCVIGVTDSEGATSASNLGCNVSSGLIEGTGNDEVYEVVGTVTADTIPGNITLRWAQNTGDASNTTVYAGSYLTAFIDGGGLTLLQGGNAFGATVTIGSTDNNGINFITNGATALSITSTGDSTLTGLATLNGGLVIGNDAGDPFTINSGSVTLNNGLNFDSNTFVIDSANNRVGINDASPGNRLNINSEATADATAQALIYTDGASNKGLVIQSTSGQTADLFQVQDENGNAIYSIRSTGRLVLGRSSFTNGSLALFNSANGFSAEFISSAVTADRTITLPDASGVICLEQSNNCGYVRIASGSDQTDGSNNDVIAIDKTTASGNLLKFERSGTSVFRVLNSGALELQLTSTAALRVMNAGGTSLFNVDTSANTVRIGALTGDGTGVLFLLDEKNNSGDPTGIEGGMYYNSSTDRFRCFEQSTWKNCIGTPSLRSFIDTTADAVVDANTTNYWDTGTENNNSSPNITLSSTSGLVVYGTVTMELTATGAQDTEVTARVERFEGSVGTCGSGTSVGGAPGVFTTNTGGLKSSTVTFVDTPPNPGTQTQYYVLCSDTATVGTNANITRIRITLQEATNAN